MDAISALYIGCMAKINSLRNSERGQTLVEYALILVLIALVAIVAMKSVGSNVSQMYSNAAGTIANP